MCLLPVIRATREDALGFNEEQRPTVVEVWSQLIGEQPSSVHRQRRYVAIQRPSRAAMDRGIP
jgi:hypothetical protein